MSKNNLFVMWVRAEIENLRQNISDNQKELRVTKEKQSTLALALKAMIAVDKKVIEVYENAIKDENT